MGEIDRDRSIQDRLPQGGRDGRKSAKQSVEHFIPVDTVATIIISSSGLLDEQKASLVQTVITAPGVLDKSELTKGERKRIRGKRRNFVTFLEVTLGLEGKEEDRIIDREESVVQEIGKLQSTITTIQEEGSARLDGILSGAFKADRRDAKPSREGTDPATDDDVAEYIVEKVKQGTDDEKEFLGGLARKLDVVVNDFSIETRRGSIIDAVGSLLDREAEGAEPRLVLSAFMEGVLERTVFSLSVVELRKFEQELERLTGRKYTL